MKSHHSIHHSIPSDEVNVDEVKLFEQADWEGKTKRLMLLVRDLIAAEDAPANSFCTPGEYALKAVRILIARRHEIELTEETLFGRLCSIADDLLIGDGAERVGRRRGGP